MKVMTDNMMMDALLTPREVVEILMRRTYPQLRQIPYANFESGPL
jgi:hypothetical protein